MIMKMKQQQQHVNHASMVSMNGNGSGCSIFVYTICMHWLYKLWCSETKSVLSVLTIYSFGHLQRILIFWICCIFHKQWIYLFDWFTWEHIKRVHMQTKTSSMQNGEKRFKSSLAERKFRVTSHLIFSSFLPHFNSVRLRVNHNPSKLVNNQIKSKFFLLNVMLNKIRPIYQRYSSSSTMIIEFIIIFQQIKLSNKRSFDQVKWIFTRR